MKVNINTEIISSQQRKSVRHDYSYSLILEVFSPLKAPQISGGGG